MTSARAPIRRVLCVDDEPHQLKLVSQLLSARLGIPITSSRFPTETLRIAGSSLFDMIVIDVTMQYGGSPFGGIELYRQLATRYGRDSVIVYSQYITEELLKRHDYPFHFVETGDDPDAFGNQLAMRVRELRRQQTCFVAMPFEDALDPVWHAVRRGIQAAAFKPARVDKQPFNGSIVERMFQEIRDAKVVVFVAASRNANVFYEAGFARALGKEIVTVTDRHDALPFDVRDQNVIEFGDDLKKLETQLSNRLRVRL